MLPSVTVPNLTQEIPLFAAGGVMPGMRWDGTSIIMLFYNHYLPLPLLVRAKYIQLILPISLEFKSSFMPGISLSLSVI